MIRKEDVLRESRTFSVSYDFGQDYDDVSVEVVLVDDIEDLEDIDCQEVVYCELCKHFKYIDKENISKAECIEWLNGLDDDMTKTVKQIRNHFDSLFMANPTKGWCSKHEWTVDACDFCSRGEVR